MIGHIPWMILLYPVLAGDIGPDPVSHPMNGATAPIPSNAPVQRDTVFDPRDPEIIRTEDFSMTIGSRIQARYSYMDPDEGAANGSFGIRRARLSMTGDAHDHFQYAIQLGLEGPSVHLLDANIRYSPSSIAVLRVGQSKVAFGRQQTMSSGSQNFVDRTIVAGRFSGGRQVGVDLSGRTEGEAFEYSAGLYNGNGPNVANDNNRYMGVARAVWTPLGAYRPVESAHDYPASPRVALGGAVLHTTEGSGGTRADLTRVNAEAAFKLQGFNTTAELFRERVTPETGTRSETDGWYVQAGFLLADRRNEIAARYATVQPDTAADTDVIEMGVAFSHYLRQHRAKVQADLRSVERKLPGTRDTELRVQIQLSL